MTRAARMHVGTRWFAGVLAAVVMASAAGGQDTAPTMPNVPQFSPTKAFSSPPQFLPITQNVKSPFAPMAVRTPLLAAEYRPADLVVFFAQERMGIDGAVSSEDDVTLILGRPRLVLLKSPPRDVTAFDGNVVRRNFVEPNELILIGQAAGSTLVKIHWEDDDGKRSVRTLFVHVARSPEDVENLRRVFDVLRCGFEELFPNSEIRPVLVGGRIFFVRR